jgi:hypothetical protein
MGQSWGYSLTCKVSTMREDTYLSSI